MPKNLTEYNLLFSCPGDAYAECYSLIKTVIDDFNKYSKPSLSLGVNLTHWSTDSYPQSGGHPQTLLNAQIVDSADAAIVVFWTRFGTPTDEYGSGTEEEIDHLINSNKQVFLYFLEKPIPPSMADSATFQEQRKQIVEFRKKYMSKGIYWMVSDEAALKEQFSRHLFLYFAKQELEATSTLAGSDRSALKLTAANGINNVSLQHLMLSIDMKIEARKSSIIEKIKVVQGITLPPQNREYGVEPTSGKSVLSEPYSKFVESKYTSKKMIDILSSKTQTTISEDKRSIVLKFCAENGIDLKDSFWYLGGLHMTTAIEVMYVDGAGRARSLVGTEDEKRKYEIIQEIVNDCYHYYDSATFFHKMDAIPYVELVVRNEGTTFDEDIEICLTLKRDILMQADEFPAPLFELENIVEEDLVDNWFCPVVTANISRFDYSPTYAPNSTPYIPTINFPFRNRDYKAEYEQKREEYYDRIKELYDWDIFHQGEIDTVKIRIRKLNQFRTMHLPSRLFFKSVPDKIEYSITAKYTPSVITGEIEVME